MPEKEGKKENDEESLQFEIIANKFSEEIHPQVEIVSQIPHKQKILETKNIKQKVKMHTFDQRGTIRLASVMADCQQIKSNLFKALNKNSCQPRIPYPTKLSSKNQGELKKCLGIKTVYVSQILSHRNSQESTMTVFKANSWKGMSN